MSVRDNSGINKCRIGQVPLYLDILGDLECVHLNLYFALSVFVLTIIYCILLRLWFLALQRNLNKQQILCDPQAGPTVFQSIFCGFESMVMVRS